MAGKVPVTGQDATVEGLQAVLSGDQCLTIYKQLKPEADTAARLAIDLYKGQKPPVKSQIKDPESGAYVPAELLSPVEIKKADVKSVVSAGFVSKKDLCAGKYAALCAENGI